MANARLLAKVGVKGKPGELVFYKKGNLYAVPAKKGGTKGAKRKCSPKKSAPKPKAVAKKKPAAKKTAAGPKYKVAVIWPDGKNTRYSVNGEWTTKANFQKAVKNGKLISSGMRKVGGKDAEKFWHKTLY